MFFKNLSIFKMVEEIQADRFTTFLDSHPFSPCLKSQERSAGFATLYGSQDRVVKVGRFLLFCMLIEEKLIPASAVKTQFLRKVEEYEQKHQAKLSRNDRKELKERIVNEMIQQAFTKTTEIWSYIDTREKLLVVNTGSAKQADAVASLVKNATEGRQVFPYRPQESLPSKMREWVIESKAPDDFAFLDKCEVLSSEGSIKYRNFDLQDAGLKDYLLQGMSVDNLQMEFKERVSFVLRGDFVITQIKLADKALEDLDKGADYSNANDSLQATLTLFGDEMSDLVSSLMRAAGGPQGGLEGIGQVSR